MSSPQKFSEQMRAELSQLKSEFEKIKTDAAHLGTDLELEYFTLIEELQVEVHALEQKFELFVETHDPAWQEFKTDLERSWESLRELVKGITAP